MLHRKSVVPACLWAACSVLVGVWGCTRPPGYLFSVALGELELLSSSVPLEEALSDPTLTDEEREKIAFVIRARDYADQVVGLNVTGSYQSFVSLSGDSLAWNLSASRKDALEPYTWPIPFAGALPYLGFFEFHKAIAERDRLVSLGYDTFLYEVDAYALTFIPDPLFSPLLRRDLPSLADTVMHELTHNTVLRPGDTTFNESLAMFVGRTASLEFLEAEFGPDAPIVNQTRLAYEDEDRFNAFLQELMAELNELYQSNEWPWVKIANREQVFQSARERFAAEVLPLMNDPSHYEGYSHFPFNNAFLLANARYNSDMDVYSGIYEMTGRNWHEAMAIFAEAANSDDPVQSLRDRLARGESGR